MQCPIYPVVISNYKHYNLNKKIFNSDKVYINFLPAILTEGLNELDVNGLTESVRNLMIKEYNIMNKKYD